MTIIEKIRIIARDVLGLDPEYITEDMRIREDLGITERMGFDLYAKAQEIFPGLDVSIQEAERIITVGDLEELIRKKVGDSN